MSRSRPGASPAVAAGRRDTVSPTSARRFAARARSRRWLRLRPLLAAAALAALAGGLAWVVLVSDLLAVRAVEVRGERRLSERELRAVVAVPAGRPLARVDTDAVAARVAALPAVASVDVRRQWPHTLLVEVTERRVAAAVPQPDGGYRLVDRTGVPFDQVVARPPGVPLVDAFPGLGGARAVSAALDALDALPARIARRVESVSAETAGNVVLHLDRGVRVRWGDATDSAEKARVLAALIRRPAKVYDVSAPGAPATRG